MSQEEQLKELPKDDWLFVCKRYVNKIYSKMKPRYFSEDFKEVCEQLELRNITPKSLRRWFSSTLENHSINKDIVKRMMGQNVDVRAEHYNLMLEQAKEGIVDEFAKFFTTEIDNILTLGNGNRKITQVDKRVENVEQLNKDLVGELDSTNKKLDELSETIGFMSKFLLSLDQNFREVVDDSYIPKESDFVLFSIDEMKEFRERAK